MALGRLVCLYGLWLRVRRLRWRDRAAAPYLLALPCSGAWMDACRARSCGATQGAHFVWATLYQAPSQHAGSFHLPPAPWQPQTCGHRGPVAAPPPAACRSDHCLGSIGRCKRRLRVRSLEGALEQARAWWRPGAAQHACCALGCRWRGSGGAYEQLTWDIGPFLLSCTPGVDRVLQPCLQSSALTYLLVHINLQISSMAPRSK